MADWGPDPNPYTHPVARVAYYVTQFLVLILSLGAVVWAMLFAGMIFS